MNSQETFYEYIMNWLDKLNIELEVTQSELKEALSVISEKVIAYEVITSIVTMLLFIAAIVLMIIVFLKVTKCKSIKAGIQYTKKLDINADLDKVLIILVIAVLLFFTILGIVIQVIDIIECIVFPEKIILEFIGRYL